MQTKHTFIAFIALLGLAACSTGSDIERALVGGVAGCVAGEIIDDGECATGALLGAGVGALADDI